MVVGDVLISFDKIKQHSCPLLLLQGRVQEKVQNNSIVTNGFALAVVTKFIYVRRHWLHKIAASEMMHVRCIT